MGRLINTDDLNNVVQVQSKEYGRLAVEIEHIVEDMVRQVTTAQDISPLKQLKEEVEKRLDDERFSRRVYAEEEVDHDKYKMCSGGVIAYENVLKIINTMIKESEGK